MSRAAVGNGVEIEYEVFGDPSHPTMVLISGLGAQLTQWQPEFVALLVDLDLQVVRFDNRDVGLSSRLDGDYQLTDMVADLAGLLDHLGVDSAHVVGGSMGGMIAQQFAIEHRDRTLSLTSIRSSSGAPLGSGPSPEVLAVMTRRPAEDPEERVDELVAANAMLGTPGTDPVALRARILADLARAPDDGGRARQSRAVRSAPDRTDALRDLDVPALVVHGTNDQLIGPEAGVLTADALAGSELLLVDGMGHDLPERAWPEIVAAIARVVARANSVASRPGVEESAPG